jgi:hypothetical protein
MSALKPTTGPGAPGSLLKDAWQAGAVPRLTMIIGLIVSAALCTLIVVGTVRFIVHTVHEPALGWGLKVAAVIFVPIFVLILLVSVPAAWLMFVLNWVTRRHRAGSESKP